MNFKLTIRQAPSVPKGLKPDLGRSVQVIWNLDGANYMTPGHQPTNTASYPRTKTITKHYTSQCIKNLATQAFVLTSNRPVWSPKIMVDLEAGP